MPESQRDLPPTQQGPPVTDLTLWQRGFAAGVASLVSSVAMNPLDVVKTRMQAQATSKMFTSGTAGGGSAARFSCGTMGLTAWPQFHDVVGSGPNAPVFRAPPKSPTYRGSFDGLFKIARHEGVQTLWRGTDAAVLMTVPLVAIYLPLYDHILGHCSSAGAYAPLIAGGVSRAVAGFVTAPLELARVRMQAAQQQAPAGSGGSGGGILKQLAPQPGASRLQSVTSLWTGIGASMAKDVPFAALYWSMLEPLRGALMRLDYNNLDYQGLAAQWQNGNINEMPVVADFDGLPQVRSSAEVLAINIAAAGVAASAAAAVTTPFDVVKTKQQTAKGKPGGIVHCLVKITQTGGVRALFAGASPRTARTAAGYAIVTSLFEVFKVWAKQGVL